MSPITKAKMPIDSATSKVLSKAQDERTRSRNTLGPTYSTPFVINKATAKSPATCAEDLSSVPATIFHAPQRVLVPLCSRKTSRKGPKESRAPASLHPMDDSSFVLIALLDDLCFNIDNLLGIQPGKWLDIPILQPRIPCLALRNSARPSRMRTEIGSAIVLFLKNLRHIRAIPRPCHAIITGGRRKGVTFRGLLSCAIAMRIADYWSDGFFGGSSREFVMGCLEGKVVYEVMWEVRKVYYGGKGDERVERGFEELRVAERWE